MVAKREKSKKKEMLLEITFKDGKEEYPEASYNNAAKVFRKNGLKLLKSNFSDFKRSIELMMKSVKVYVKLPTGLQGTWQLRIPADATGAATSEKYTYKGPSGTKISELPSGTNFEYVPLWKFAKNCKKFPLDWVVDCFDPSKLPKDYLTSDMLYLALDENVDSMVADTLLGLLEEDLDFYSNFRDDHRTVHILRGLGRFADGLIELMIEVHDTLI